MPFNLAESKQLPGAFDAWPLHALIVALGAGVVVLAWRRGVIGPRAFAGRPLRDVSAAPMEVWFLLPLVLYLTLVLAQTTALALTPDPASSQGQAVAPAVGYGVTIAFAVALHLVLLRAARPRQASSPGSSAPPAPPAPPNPLLAAAIGALWFAGVLLPVLAVGVLATLVQTLVAGSPPPELAHPTLERIVAHPTDPWLWLVIASPVIGAPIVEEYVFRLGLQSAIRRMGVSPGLAIIAASVLFMLVHLSAVPLHALPTLLALGLGMGLAFERTRSLVAPIVMHALFNALNIAMAIWMTRGG